VLFFWYLYPSIVDYRKEIFLGVGIFYLVTFLVMCLNVKEGHYPAPTPTGQELRSAAARRSAPLSYQLEFIAKLS
jgi:hypothetical protein